MFLKGASFRPLERTAVVRFADIGTLKKDNEVTVSGYPVGKVVSVEFKEPGDVRVTISIPPTLDLRADASAEISSGVFSSDSRILLPRGGWGEAPRWRRHPGRRRGRDLRQGCRPRRPR
jgi:hypothetical protein